MLRVLNSTRKKGNTYIIIQSSFLLYTTHSTRPFIQHAAVWNNDTISLSGMAFKRLQEAEADVALHDVRRHHVITHRQRKEEKKTQLWVVVRRRRALCGVPTSTLNMPGGRAGLAEAPPTDMWKETVRHRQSLSNKRGVITIGKGVQAARPSPCLCIGKLWKEDCHWLAFPPHYYAKRLLPGNHQKPSSNLPP